MTADWKEKMAAKADAVFLEVLKKIGITIDNAHLQPEKTRTAFWRTMERSLNEHSVDLSYTSAESAIVGKIGGNDSGIASDYCMAIFTRPWKEISMTPSEIEKYFSCHKDARILGRSTPPRPWLVSHPSDISQHR